MQSIQVGQFKSELSSILEKIQKDGEAVVIEFGKSHKKVAMLVPYVDNLKPRTFGLLNGLLGVPDNFDDESDEINKMFYGK